MTVEQGVQPYQGPAPDQGQVIQGQVQRYSEYAGTTGQNLPISRDELAQLESGIDGLSADEIPTPRLLIDHHQGVYTDNQTEVPRTELIGIVLGFVRQRIMWPKELPDDGGSPMCKSNDSENGLPNMDPASEFAFPFAESPFNPNDLQVNQELNRVLLPCSNCTFTDWSGQGNKTPPRCSEVFNLIVMFDAYGTGDLQPAFFPLKKSALKNAKAFLARFKQRSLPAYSEFAHFTLEHRKRGGNPYSVPVIKAAGPTNPEMWPAFSENYASLRDFAMRTRPLDSGADTGVQQQFEAAPEQYSQPPQQSYSAPAPAASPAPAPQQQYVAPQTPAYTQAVPETPAPAPAAPPAQPAPAPAPAPQTVAYQQPAPPPPPPAAVAAPAPPPPPPAPQPAAPQAPAPAAQAAPQAAPAPPVETAPQSTPTWAAAGTPAAAVPEEDDGLPF